MPTEPSDAQRGPPIPLWRWADRQLRELAAISGSERIAALDGLSIIGERGSLRDFEIRGRRSAGIGGSYLNPTRDGSWFALTIMREEDRAYLPALFGKEGMETADQTQLAAEIALRDSTRLLADGRALGMAVACADETPVSPPIEILTRGKRRDRPQGHRPIVIDMSAIWAGPLCGHLLWQAGADVIKVENPNRPDLFRTSDPQTFEAVNQGKECVALDLTKANDRDRLVALIRKADMVIEASRPRALRHLGVDADALVREVPGLVWLSITGHGASGDAANWVGVGNDCAVAGGLARALANATGEIGYVGDALADPLTGITAALEGWRAYTNGEAIRIGFSMSAIAAKALEEERAFDAAALDEELRDWGASVGKLFPKVPARLGLAPVHALGADTEKWLDRLDLS
ncbi:MAG: CoA transferase [Novosphingobium sp.]|nr:CoA transferase [Novosphingobium sp.]